MEDAEGGGSVRRIRFTPTAQRKGLVEVRLRASDPEGNENEERFQVRRTPKFGPGAKL
jgi:hypothetical protein